VFLSHNNSAGTVFFSQFQPSFRPANGAFAVLDQDQDLNNTFFDCMWKGIHQKNKSGQVHGIYCVKELFVAISLSV